MLNRNHPKDQKAMDSSKPVHKSGDPAANGCRAEVRSVQRYWFCACQVNCTSILLTR